MSKTAAAKEQIQVIKTANNNNVTDTQIESYRREKKRGTIAKQETETALLLSDGIERNGRMIGDEMGIEARNYTRNINNLKKRKIIATPTKKKCPFKNGETAFYTLNSELLALSTKGKTLEFFAELEKQLKTPIRDIPKMMINNLKKKGVFAAETRKRHVLAFTGQKVTQYLTEPITAAERSRIEDANVEIVEVFSFSEFLSVFQLEKL
jgi:hypothetical protein